MSFQRLLQVTDSSNFHEYHIHHSYSFRRELHVFTSHLKRDGCSNKQGDGQDSGMTGLSDLT